MRRRDLKIKVLCRDRIIGAATDLRQTILSFGRDDRVDSMTGLSSVKRKTVFGRMNVFNLD